MTPEQFGIEYVMGVGLALIHQKKYTLCGNSRKSLKTLGKRLQIIKAKTASKAGMLAARARAKLPLDDIVDQFKDLLSVSWEKQNRSALIQALDVLQSDKGPVTWAEYQVIEDMTSEVLGVPVGTAIQRPLFSIQKSSYLKGMGEAGKQAGVHVMWNLPDTKSLRVLDKNTQFWIGSYFDDNLQEGFRATMQDFFQGGYDRKSLATLMRVHFENVAKKGDPYWDLLADHTVTKTREIGRVSGYREAGIETVRIRARLDSSTTPQCRNLHGHVISVKRIGDQVDNYLKACETRDKEKIKKSWPWLTEKDAKNKLNTPQKINKEMAKGNVGLPPFHARCRTITVAEFVEDAGAHVSEKDMPKGEKPVMSDYRPKGKKREWRKPTAKPKPKPVVHDMKQDQGWFQDAIRMNMEDGATKLSDLREYLGWGKKRFDSVLRSLKKKKIIHSTGYGKVGFPKPKPVTPAKPKPVAPATLEKNKKLVSDAYYKLSGGQSNVRVRLADLQDELSTMSREDFKRAVRSLEKDQNAALYPLNDPSEIHARDIKSAFDVFGKKRHIMYLESRYKIPKPKPVAPAKPKPVKSIKKTQGHINHKSQWGGLDIMPRDQSIQKILSDAEAAGITMTKETAGAVYDAINDFTAISYKAMRNAQLGRVVDAEELSKARLVEEYLDIAPKFPTKTGVEKALWRGMRGKSEEFQWLKEGAEYDLKALASFSSDRTTAQSFTDKVLLKFTGDTDMATTIQHISDHPGEMEVLFSGRNVLKIVKKETKRHRKYAFKGTKAEYDEFYSAEAYEDYLIVTVKLEKITPLTREIIKIYIRKTVEKKTLESLQKPQKLRDEQSEFDATLPMHVKQDGVNYILHANGQREKVSATTSK